MFDMKEVGQRLSVMRKNAHLTQMELANHLGISYQAVSNWERGVSMPDIANIGPLAEALGVTVDDIIGNKKISSIVKGEQPEEKLTLEEFNAVSPLLEPDKNTELLLSKVNYTVTEDHNGVGIEAFDKAEINVSSLCLTQEEIDELFRKAALEGNNGLLAIIKGHASQRVIEEIFVYGVKNSNTSIVAILKNKVSESVIEKMFIYGVQNGSTSIVAVLKHMVSKETLKNALYSSVENGNAALVAILMKAAKSNNSEKDDDDEDWDDEEDWNEDNDWDDDNE